MTKKVIVVLGPTGIGKSDLALKIAKSFRFDLLSADAFMVYKDMNIGTNKPTKQEQNAVENYYGLDLVDLNTNYNIFSFQSYARNIIEHAKQPIIIVGGSMLYLDSVIYDYSLDPHFDNSNKHEELDDEQLYEKLISLDPLCLNRVQKQNRKRVITALNYFLQFNKSITLNNNKKALFYDCLFIYIKPDDKWDLNRQNANRIDQMFALGWENEVKELLIKYPNFLKTNAAKAIGYSEIADALINQKKIDKGSIINRTNHFVKHQLSWYKKQEANYFVVNKQTPFDVIQKKVNDFLKNE